MYSTVYIDNYRYLYVFFIYTGKSVLFKYNDKHRYRMVYFKYKFFKYLGNFMAIENCKKI